MNKTICDLNDLPILRFTGIHVLSLLPLFINTGCNHMGAGPEQRETSCSGSVHRCASVLPVTTPSVHPAVLKRAGSSTGKTWPQIAHGRTVLRPVWWSHTTFGARSFLACSKGHLRQLWVGHHGNGHFGLLARQSHVRMAHMTAVLSLPWSGHTHRFRI